MRDKADLFLPGSLLLLSTLTFVIGLFLSSRRGGGTGSGGLRDDRSFGDAFAFTLAGGLGCSGLGDLGGCSGGLGRGRLDGGSFDGSSLDGSSIDGSTGGTGATGGGSSGLFLHREAFGQAVFNLLDALLQEFGGVFFAFVLDHLVGDHGPFLLGEIGLDLLFGSHELGRFAIFEMGEVGLGGTSRVSSSLGSSLESY